MKIIVKTLKGETYVFELSSEASILDVKQKITGEKKIPTESQNLIYKGKATKNEHLISSYSIEENEHLTLMTVIKKPERKQKEEKEMNISQNIQPQKQTPAKVQNEAQQQVKTQTKKIEKKKKKDKDFLNEEFQAKVSFLMGMGFERLKCVAALRAAYNDSDRATQYLLQGIPKKKQEQVVKNELEENQEFIRQLIEKNQSIRQIVQLIKKDPTATEPILTQMAVSSPKLHSLIKNNRKTFQKILHGKEKESNLKAEKQKSKKASKLLPEEKKAIKNLISMGFRKKDAKEAYFVCDKNEELAASYLYNRLEKGQIPSLFEPEKKEEDSTGKKFKEEE